MQRRISKYTLDLLMKKRKVCVNQVDASIGAGFFSSLKKTLDSQREFYHCEVKAYMRLSRMLGVEPGVLSINKSKLPKERIEYLHNLLQINSMMLTCIISDCGGVRVFERKTGFFRSTIQRAIKKDYMMEKTVRKYANKFSQLLGGTPESYFDKITSK